MLELLTFVFRTKAFPPRSYAFVLKAATAPRDAWDFGSDAQMRSVGMDVAILQLEETQFRPKLSYPGKIGDSFFLESWRFA